MSTEEGVSLITDHNGTILGRILQIRPRKWQIYLETKIGPIKMGVPSYTKSAAGKVALNMFASPEKLYILSSEDKIGQLQLKLAKGEL
jgi:hypothetical protein